MQNTVGLLLRNIRQNAGYSLNKAARAIDINPSYLSRVERGEHLPSIGLCIAMADMFHYSRFDLLEAAGKIACNDPDPRCLFKN